MRITFVTTNINLVDGGGSNFSFHLAASELANLGHDVSVLSLKTPPASLPDTVPYRIVDIGWSDQRRFTQIRVTREAMERYEAISDVFHIYDSQLAIGAGAYRAFGGTSPVVVNLNKYMLFCTNQNAMNGSCHQNCGVTQRLLHARGPIPGRIRSIPLRLYERQRGFEYVNHVDRFLAVSPSVAEIYGQAGFDTRRCTIVPPIIDYDRIVERSGRAAPQQMAPPGSGDAWQILFAGRLVPAKGADLLVDALAKINVPAHLHIAGDGPHLGALREQVNSLQLTDRVTFHGWVPNEDLWTLYQRMHVFVHPGRWPEPGGRTILEAMTIGIPTIVSDIGGPPWILGDAGLTFEPGNSGDLARKLHELIDGYAGWPSRLMTGRNRAATFDRRHLAGSLEQVYQQVTASAS